jgi:hypothetical protein
MTIRMREENIGIGAGTHSAGEEKTKFSQRKGEPQISDQNIDPWG